jgi:hypothetical protein
VGVEVAPPLTVVLVNNKGGGIFSFLPVAGAVGQEAFERLWGTPQNVDLEGTFCGIWFVTRSHQQVPFCFWCPVAVAGDVGHEAFGRLWGTPQNVDLEGKACL